MSHFFSETDNISTEINPNLLGDIVGSGGA